MRLRLVAPIVLAVTTIVEGQQLPNFRTEISFVELPVRVLDGKGNFVRDLGVFDGMRVLADSTGGFVVDNVNNFDKAFDRIVRENSSYYVIGYYSTNDKADGKTQKNEIKLARKGMQVLYRPSYIAARN